MKKQHLIKKTYDPKYLDISIKAKPGMPAATSGSLMFGIFATYSKIYQLKPLKIPSHVIENAKTFGAAGLDE